MAKQNENRIKIPKMRIAILVVGTHGDVAPFVAIGKVLKSHGHRVRVATHENYRDFVKSHDLEFYPLAGDPKQLSSYMVESQGRIISFRYDLVVNHIPKHMKMLESIIYSKWDAVQNHEEGEPPFQAQAIISNPITYGHFHVAERLQVPLHIMFPQPWLPTKAFPHPLSNLPYDNGKSEVNKASYKAVAQLMWSSLRSYINDFRTEVLGLNKMRLGSGGRKLLRTVPHAFLYSPLLLPKPADWGAHVDVVGNVILNKTASSYDPPPALKEFLTKHKNKKSKIIFCGFGSMVMNDEKAMESTKMIIDASVRAGVHLILQSNWTDLSALGETPDTVLIIGSCPHDWLFKQVDGAIHHGGAGTTAASLIAGKPTFIVPFFGDQHLWGFAVHSRSLGPPPVPFEKLDYTTMVHAMQFMTSEYIQKNAKDMGEALQKEDGATEAVKAFYKQLPRGKKCFNFKKHGN